MIKILLVDDAKNIVLVVKKCLEKQGYEVVTAREGLSAIKKAQKVEPDLILLDIILPKMNGFLVFEAIKEDPKTKNIPVIILSAKSEKEDLDKAMSLGAKDYLVKPIKKKDLIQSVRIVLKEENINEK